ncbi:tryptophan-rich sensory protein [Sphingomonas sp. ABOLD]|uniref:Tryptophan-rich sensory protein n=1 Tax=Sphingomonas trueperi TaxID=53317 RepID=A0A7X5XZS1_9SPHN|nr:MULTISPECIES: TspO/MBR family protein [Sphingomonas]NJB96831.1 tryptophan-rich sensory protein [Sphingomonas trueperi]RSV44452.1 tryptophan-rich sensory protein [Sphingomonas sp. ABOLE]RSV51893.1 tryptophan-rich sensory protein [Sphingomonas sp. ABOLD]
MNALASKAQLRRGFWRRALVTVPLVVLLGFGSAMVAPAGDENPWFMALAKPAIQPPNIAFPVVWTILYVLMGLALALVLSARGARGRAAAVVLFVLQLGVNLAWSPIFFRFHMLDLALIVIVALAVLVAVTMVAFWRVRTLAGLMLLPYLAWVCFASVLFSQVRDLNPDAEKIASAASNAHIHLETL